MSAALGRLESVHTITDQGAWSAGPWMGWSGPRSGVGGANRTLSRMPPRERGCCVATLGGDTSQLHKTIKTLVSQDKPRTANHEYRQKDTQEKREKERPPALPAALPHTHSGGLIMASSVFSSQEPGAGWWSYCHRAVRGRDMRMLSIRPPVLSPKMVPRSWVRLYST